MTAPSLPQVLVPVAASLAPSLVQLLAEVFAGRGDSDTAKKAHADLVLQGKREALKAARGG